jgi:xyloglucan-specific exo-beta-1,4-glucanase
MVESAKGLGFGKAAPGASYPALYLDGKINGVVGIFRSIDTGASWVRIDSAQGQYGHANYDKSTITGDPKTFGTVYVNKRGIMVGTSIN